MRNIAPKIMLALLLILAVVDVLQQLDPNLYMRGYWLRGTIVAVGVHGEDFADCPIHNAWQMRMAISIANARH